MYSWIKQSKNHPHSKKHLCVPHSGATSCFGLPRWCPKAKRCMLTSWSFPASLQLWLPVSTACSQCICTVLHVCHHYFLLFYNIFLQGYTRCSAFLLVTVHCRYTAQYLPESSLFSSVRSLVICELWLNSSHVTAVVTGNEWDVIIARGRGCQKCFHSVL